MRPQLIIIILLLAAALAYLFNISSKESIEASISTIPQQLDYDYFMVDVDSTHFAINGQAEYRIQAQRLTHYPEPDFALMESPELVIYRAGESPWFVSADKGRITNDEPSELNKIDLSDNVVIHHTDNQGQPLNIYTEFLTIFPNTKKLSTDRDVLLESSGNEIFSTGMTADLNLKQVNLLSRVRGHYE